MRYMWLGCSFKPRPNGQALASAGSVFCYDQRFINREFKHYVYGKRPHKNDLMKTAQNNSYG